MMRIAHMNLSQHSVNGDRLRASLQHGFTLTEVLVVVSILAILVAIAMPSFSDALLSSRLRSYANNLVASVHFARSEAIKRNAVVTLCASSNGTSCSGAWKNGWVILSTGAAAAVIQTQQAVDVNYKITGTNTTLSFQPTGVGATQDTITICRERPSAGSQERQVRISATGRPSVTKTSNGSC